jgi:ribokinase
MRAWGSAIPGLMQEPQHGVVVVGQIGRDLVLRLDAFPEPGGSQPVSERIERLGGKGANQAVGLRQLGVDVALIGVVGEDAAGRLALDDAALSGIDVTHVARRGRTALFVDIVEPGGRRRLLEDVPDQTLLTEADIRAAAPVIGGATVVSLQLQQPPAALLAAARLAVDSGARIVLDGAVEGPARDELLGLAQVLRADAGEAAMLAGMTLRGRGDALAAARRLLEAGPSLVALAVPGEGDLVAWRDGSRFFPHAEPAAVDPTGAGDAFVAGLIRALLDGAAPAEAGRLAADAASSTVLRPGGRPELRHPDRGGSGA